MGAVKFFSSSSYDNKPTTQIVTVEVTKPLPNPNIMEETMIKEESMWNGFYKLEFKTNRELKKFFKEAISLASRVNVDCLKDGRWSRVLDYDVTINDYVKKYVSIHHHNVCINRQVYNQNKFDDQGEIGSSSSTLGTQSRYLFIYLSIDNLNKLVEKYKLEKHI